MKKETCGFQTEPLEQKNQEKVEPASVTSSEAMQGFPWDPWEPRPDGNCAGFDRNEFGQWTKTKPPAPPQKTTENAWTSEEKTDHWEKSNGWKPWDSKEIFHYGESDHKWENESSSSYQTSVEWEKVEEYKTWEDRQPELFKKKSGMRSGALETAIGMTH